MSVEASHFRQGDVERAKAAISRMKSWMVKTINVLPKLTGALPKIIGHIREVRLPPFKTLINASAKPATNRAQPMADPMPPPFALNSSTAAAKVSYGSDERPAELGFFIANL